MVDDFDDDFTSLSNGFFQAFISNNYPANIQPILQIIESRVNPAAAIVRFRLSDGLFSYSNCASSLEIGEKMEKEGYKESHGVIQVTQFVRSMAGEKPAFNIIDYKPLQLTNTIIGDPKPHSGNASEYKGIENFPGIMNTKSEDGRQSPSRKRGFADQNNSTPSKRQNTNIPAGGVFSDGVLEISLVTPYVNRFRLCGAVSFKEEPRQINTKRGPSSVFSFVLTDVAGNSIKISAFGNECDKYSDIVQTGQAYYINCVGSYAVREANRRFNSTGHTYEITLNAQCDIELCTDRNMTLPTCKLHCIPLLDVKNHSNECVDALGVIDRVDDVSNVVAKATQKSLSRRNVVLVDDSCTQVQLTLWEGDVDKITPDMVGSVVGIKGASVREFNGGFSLSIGNGGALIMAPDGERTKQLMTWYIDQRPNAQIGSLTKLDGGASFARDCRLINTVKELDALTIENGMYLTVEACINTIKIENVAYNACPTEKCRKKVTFENNQYLCPNCGVNDSCRPTYMLSMEIADFSGLTWITLFDEAATSLIGMSASQLMDLMRDDRPAYERIFQSLRFKPFEFRVRVKIDNYNDQARIRWNCLKAGPVNVKNYTAVLKKSLAVLS